MSDLLQQLLDSLTSALPKFLLAIAVLILGYIISKIVASIIGKLLRKLNVDRISDSVNEVDFIAKSPVKIKLSSLISKITYYFLMLVALVLATDILDMPAVSELVSSIFHYIPNLFSALLVLVFGIVVSNFIKNIVETTCKSLNIPSANIIASFIFYFLFINVLILALGQAKINTSFLAQNLSLIIGGAVLAFALGYGFASKDIVANYLASFYSKNKINLGDVVKIDGVTGKVEAIDKSSLTLSNSNGVVIVPLSKMTTEKVEILNS